MNSIDYTMDNAEYRAIDAASYSMLKLLKRSPAEALASVKSPMEQTNAMLLGSILHQVVLEPQNESFWIVAPEGMDFRSNAGKEWKKANAGRPIITADESAEITGMRDAIKANATAAELLAIGSAEVSCFSSVQTDSGIVPVKCRIDFVPQKCRYLVDVKTTDDASQESFQKTAIAYGYHIQAAFYLDMWNAISGDPRESFVFIAVEKEAKQWDGSKLVHGCQCFEVGEDLLTMGRKELSGLLEIYGKCRTTGIWPGYAGGLQPLELPGWLKRNN